LERPVAAMRMSVIRGAAHGEQQPMAGWLEGEPMYIDKQLVIRHTVPPNGLTFAGILDLFNAEAVAGSVATMLDGEGDLHIDLSRVEFCDVSGIRALVSAAESGRRRLVMHGLPPPLHRVMTLVGWGDLPSLLLCDCRTERT
jgi:anti-anti-sigma regulatory factor